MYCSTRKNGFAALALITLMSSASAFASGSFGPGVFTSDSDSSPALPSITKEADSWYRLKNALKDVEETPEIKSLLKERQIHGLNVTQRVLGTHLETTKFQHFYKGLEVVGSMAFHHNNSRGAWISNKIRSFDLSTTPSISAEDALAISRSVAGDRTLRNTPELKILPEENPHSAKLVYWMELSEAGLDGARKVIIDAHSGNVIGNISENIEIAPIEIYTAKNQGIAVTFITDPSGKTLKECEILDLATQKTQKVDAQTCNRLGSNQCQVLLEGDPVIVNPQYCARTSPSSVVIRLRTDSDAVSNQALQNSKSVLNYYFNTHKRDSYDNRGSRLISVVHAGVGYSNAHWDGAKNQMVYGEGDGKRLADFTSALDVAGHEVTHGITSVTAQLLNMGESGALNEAYSDFFGKMIDNDGDWAIGKKLFLTPGAPGIRNLEDPHQIMSRLTKKPYPAHMNEKVPSPARCDQSNDNCYVHINATIAGHAGYLVVQAIGKEKAERLYYTVLTQALGANDTLQTAGDETKKVCKQMYDAGTCSQVERALAQVGL